MDNTRTDISTYHMAADANAFEVQKSNAFKFIVTNLDPLISPVTGRVIPNAADILKQSVFSFDPPSFSQPAIEVRMGNMVNKTAGTPTFSDGTLSLHDFVGVATYDILYAWQALSFNIQTGRVGMAGDYKKTAYLLEYTTDFSKVIRVWKLYGVWVSDLKRDGFNNAENASEIKINCNLSYDWAEPQDPSQL